MADADVTVNDNTATSRKVDTRTVGAGTDEHRQVVCIGDPTTAANVAAVDASGRLTLAPNQSVNLAQVNGVTTQTGTGAAGTGTQRVAVASDSSVVLAAGTATVGAVTTPGTSTTVDVALASAATSAQVLAANANRRALLLNNTDANVVYLYYGTTATAAKFTVKIPAGGYWEMPSPPWTGRIDAIWAADGTGSLIGSELS